VWDFFFNARSAAARTSDAVGRTICELVLKFVASPPDGLVMQTGNFRDLFDPSMPQPHRFTTGNPAPLLFIESIQKSIELSMFIPRGIIQPRSTCGTTTPVAWLPCHFAPILSIKRSAKILLDYLHFTE
jgi:hypothetical protein